MQPTPVMKVPSHDGTKQVILILFYRKDTEDTESIRKREDERTRQGALSRFQVFFASLRCFSLVIPFSRFLAFSASPRLCGGLYPP